MKLPQKLSDFRRKIEKPDSRVVGIYLLLLAAVILKLTAAALVLDAAFIAYVIAKNKTDLAFYLGVFSLSFDQLFVSVGFSLKIHMLVFLAPAISLAYQYFRQNKFPKLPSHAINVSLFFLLVFSAISIYPAQDKILAVRFLASLLYAMAVFFLSTFFIRNRQAVIKTIYFLVLGMVVSIAVALQQYIAYYFNLPYFGDVGIYNPGNFARPAGLFDHPNFLANFLLVAIPLIISYAFWFKGRFVAKSTLIAVSLIALIITFSRAAYIGMAFFLAVVLFFARGTKQILAWSKFLLIILLFVAIGFSSLFYLVGPNNIFGIGVDEVNFDDRVVLNRVASSVDPNAEVNAERVLILQSGLKMLSENWLFGVGLENFRVRYKEYKAPEAVRDVVVAHNTYFQLLIETGIFGALAFAVFWIAVFLRNLKALLRSDRSSFYFYILLGGMAALLGVTFQNLTNSVLYYPHTWFLYGFIIAVSTLAVRKR